MQGSAVNKYLKTVPPRNSIRNANEEHEKSDTLCSEGPPSPAGSAELSRLHAPRLTGSPGFGSWSEGRRGHGSITTGQHFSSLNHRPFNQSNHVLFSRLPLLCGKPRSPRALGSLKGPWKRFSRTQRAAASTSFYENSSTYS